MNENERGKRTRWICQDQREKRRGNYRKSRALENNKEKRRKNKKGSVENLEK